MTISTKSVTTRQRADLTFKENIQHGRHGWFRLTPAYSVPLVDGVLAEFAVGATSVFEPFSGTGTTPLCSAYRGLHAVATDINPFLVWLGRVKCSSYTEADQRNLRVTAEAIVQNIRDGKARQSPLPPLKNIDRWWNPSELAFIRHLRSELDSVPAGPIRDLMTVVFCRTMIALSNAAFNHQSMSFKDDLPNQQRALIFDESSTRLIDQFLLDVGVVADSATDNPAGSFLIEQADARGMFASKAIDEKFDILITSPPYPNRMSYIRELRPYMYWLGYLEVASEAADLDWEAIGGTWGTATSRLLTWTPTDSFIPEYLTTIIKSIRGAHPKNGELLAQYVHKYFDDMFKHFEGAAKLVRPGGTAHYIVGNSTFYGNVVPAERLYCDQLKRVGFKNAKSRVIRKRNSKKELFEYHVVAER